VIVPALLVAAIAVPIVTQVTGLSNNPVNLRVLLVGGGSSDPTTVAWATTLQSEGVPYTEVDGAGALGSETVTLPALTSGSTGLYNGVVFSDATAMPSRRRASD
jgi:hypothetical protein